MNRRNFVTLATLAGGSLLLPAGLRSAVDSDKNKGNREETSGYIFRQIIKYADEQKWKSLPVGEIMGKIATLLLGTKYVGGTLEGESEVCRVDLTGLDCVTLFENVLGIARIYKKGKYSFEDLLKEITFTRYRGGILGDYSSRLHYTSEWISDNEAKKTVKNITKDIGGEKFPLHVSFMSENPKLYPPLKKALDLVEKIAAIEQSVNAHEHWFIPTDKIKDAEQFLKTGDIIAVATNKKGLDYAHTGLAFRDEAGKIHLLHASLKEKKVILDHEPSVYVQSVKTHIGIAVARPLEV